jgi:hypothetical protein
MILPSVRAIASEKELVVNGYVTIDMEHGAIGVDVAVEITRAIRT